MIILITKVTVSILNKKKRKKSILGDSIFSNEVSTFTFNSSIFAQSQNVLSSLGMKRFDPNYNNIDNDNLFAFNPLYWKGYLRCNWTKEYDATTDKFASNISESFGWDRLGWRNPTISSERKFVQSNIFYNLLFTGFIHIMS